VSAASGVRITIADEGGISRAILETRRLCDELEFRADLGSRVTTSVSELARNILKYAGRGEIRLRRIGESHRPGIEVTATDRGPGIESLDRALEDHYSSSGTLGLGLPGVKRMMDDFKIESTPGIGTRVCAVLWR
jgi:serine/threonine-protein kinase RsbT